MLVWDLATGELVVGAKEHRTPVQAPQEPGPPQREAQQSATYEAPPSSAPDTFQMPSGRPGGAHRAPDPEPEPTPTFGPTPTPTFEPTPTPTFEPTPSIVSIGAIRQGLDRDGLIRQVRERLEAMAPGAPAARPVPIRLAEVR